MKRSSNCRYALVLAILFALFLLVHAIWFQPDAQNTHTAYIQFLQTSHPRLASPVFPAVLRVFADNLCTFAQMIPLGFLLPIGLIVLAGAARGLILQLVMSTQFGTPLWKALLLGFLPHGIFELSALLLSLAIGFRLLISCAQCLQLPRGQIPQHLLAALRRTLRDYVLIIVPLTALAAIFECYVTPFVQTLL